MNNDKIIEENDASAAHREQAAKQEAPAGEQREANALVGKEPSPLDDVQPLLEKLGVSESIAASARVIVQSLREGNATSESIVKLVVQALRHDEDLKNAETQGYLRGRNEVIAAATPTPDEKSPRPLNFPIYTKRSFWDK